VEAAAAAVMAAMVVVMVVAMVVVMVAAAVVVVVALGPKGMSTARWASAALLGAVKLTRAPASLLLLLLALLPPPLVLQLPGGGVSAAASSLHDSSATSLMLWPSPSSLSVLARQMSLSCLWRVVVVVVATNAAGPLQLLPSLARALARITRPEAANQCKASKNGYWKLGGSRLRRSMLATRICWSLRLC
jgi:hypothetical protein